MRRTPQAKRVVERLLREDDETMPMAQALVRAAKEEGWNVSIHHDTIAVGKDDIAGVVWYDEGKPAEVMIKIGGKERNVDPSVALDPKEFLNFLIQRTTRELTPAH